MAKLENPLSPNGFGPQNDPETPQLGHPSDGGQVGQVGAPRSLFDPEPATSKPSGFCPECDHPIAGAHYYWCTVAAKDAATSDRYGLQIMVEEEETLARIRAGREEVEALAAHARAGDAEAVTELRRRADTGDAEAAAAVAAGEAALQAAADLLRETLGAEEVE